MSSQEALPAPKPVAATNAAEDRAGVWWPRIALMIIVLAMTLRPGDAPWINDEPTLIKFALGFSALPTDSYLIHLPFTPAQFGLQGTRGAWYGPAPVWFYQVLLAFTHDPLALVVMHALVVGGISALGLYWLARVMRVTPWLAVVAMLSPWIWHYSRQLWDNSFNIPLSALLLAAYGDFLSTRRPWSLRLVIFCILIMPLVHFMSLPMVVVVLLHLLIFHYRSILRSKWSLLSIVVIVEIAAWPYWAYLRDHYHSTVPPGTSPVYGWLYPLLGAHHITSAGLGNILGDRWFESLGNGGSSLVFVAQSISLLAYPACWIGMGLAAHRASKMFRRGEQISPMDHLSAVCLGTWLCQTLLDGIEHVYEGPHYYNGTWIIYVFFVWLALSRLLQRKVDGRLIGALVLGIHAMVLMLVLIAAEFKIIRDGGSLCLNYGTILGNQIDAMHQLNQFSPDSPRIIEVPQWTSFHWTFDVLHGLVSAVGSERRPVMPLRIHYRNSSGTDARIVVEPATIN
jgi:hypothetical protein